MRMISTLGIAAGAWLGAQTTASAVVHIDVNLGAQRMHVASDSGQAYDWPVSSGRKGHATPVGAFRPQRMFVMVRSLKYDNAPMPHAIFFYGPYAIHGTGAVGHLGHPASHGCIRLAPENAARLFSMVEKEGASIHISGAPAASEESPHRAGHRLAAAWRKHHRAHAFAYAPEPKRRSLKDWARRPLGY